LTRLLGSDFSDFLWTITMIFNFDQKKFIMKNQQKSLFQYDSEKRIRLQNRIVMAPMTRSRAIGSLPNALMAEYYAQRSTAGLIITEGNAPSPNGLGYARIPGIFSKAQIDGWKEVTKSVHQAGGKIFTQLMHVGRIAHPKNMPANARMLAPSAIAAKGDMWTDSDGMQQMPVPAAMTVADIEFALQEFVQAAKNAMEAGFDGVEIHGANGYLVEQFINPHANERNDQYGGTIENRSRFLLQLTKLVADAIGSDKVGVRLSPYNTFNDMPHYNEIPETYTYLSRELQALDVLYIHVIDYAARASDDGLALLTDIRNNFTNLLILNGGYDRQRAEHAITNNEADLISFGSPFISNPDLPHRLRHNVPLAPPDRTKFYTPDESGYIDYAVAKSETIM
jgi:N-ethylmaleimide reductase